MHWIEGLQQVCWGLNWHHVCMAHALPELKKLSPYSDPTLLPQSSPFIILFPSEDVRFWVALYRDQLGPPANHGLHHTTAPCNYSHVIHS